MRNNIHTITTMKETLSIRFIRHRSLIYVQVLRLKITEYLHRNTITVTIDDKEMYSISIE